MYQLSLTIPNIHKRLTEQSHHQVTLAKSILTNCFFTFEDIIRYQFSLHVLLWLAFLPLGQDVVGFILIYVYPLTEYAVPVSVWVFFWVLWFSAGHV